MADLKIDILVIPTYNTFTLGVMDNSTYVTDPPTVTSPTIEITAPGFDAVSLSFTFNSLNIFTSEDLEITAAGEDTCAIPDGVYYLTYSVDDGGTIVAIEKSIIRVDKLLQKFDESFMTLDMMECDKALKAQSKVHLTSVYFFIQGAIAAANNCAVMESDKLYQKADAMLDSFINNNCGCTGNNYLITYF